jgi:hypothetical protein
LNKSPKKPCPDGEVRARVTKPFAAGPAGTAKRDVKPDGDCACGPHRMLKPLVLFKPPAPHGVARRLFVPGFIAMDPGAASSGLE